jgi:hypothetical protein
MDARNNVPGLDTPQTRQRFAPGLTFAPQRLQAKAKAAPPSSKSYFHARTPRHRDYSGNPQTKPKYQRRLVLPRQVTEI